MCYCDWLLHRERGVHLWIPCLDSVPSSWFRKHLKNKLQVFITCYSSDSLLELIPNKLQYLKLRIVSIACTLEPVTFKVYIVISSCYNLVLIHSRVWSGQQSLQGAFALMFSSGHHLHAVQGFNHRNLTSAVGRFCMTGVYIRCLVCQTPLWASRCSLVFISAEQDTSRRHWSSLEVCYLSSSEDGFCWSSIYVCSV